MDDTTRYATARASFVTSFSEKDPRHKTTSITETGTREGSIVTGSGKVFDRDIAGSHHGRDGTKWLSAILPTAKARSTTAGSDQPAGVAHTAP